MSILGFSFFAVALVYSLVGFGGGSSYIALLALFDTPYHLIPVLALMGNLIVVASGSFLFAKRGFFKWHRFWPYGVTSVPLAGIGGMLNVSEQAFMLALGGTLALVSLKLLAVDRLLKKTSDHPLNLRPPNLAIQLFTGGIIGFLAGLVGIGGGIFLAPIMLLFRWANPKEVAATASGFILINSLAGLLGQWSKSSVASADIVSHWPLAIAVFLGGQIGSRLSASRMLSHQIIKDGTALLVMIVSIRVLLPGF